MSLHGKEPRDPVTGAILGAAFEVANTLGHGFLEKIYQRALAHELLNAGLPVEREVPFPVVYKGLDVGTYVADMIVAKEVIVELKAIDSSLAAPQIAQCLNYLRASGLKKGLIINFGKPRLEYKRLVL